MKQRILFLAANPAGTTVLKLDEEARAIEEEIRRASQRDLFQFVTRMAARPLDLLRALRDVKPTIVHFAGHAGTEGIYLTGDDGLPAHVTRDALLATFGAAGQCVQIVVLNGCLTESLAKALCDFVPVCVGTSTRILDDAARTFSIGFYGAIASGESAARACLQGSAAMHLAAVGDHDKPHLHHRRDIDPDTPFAIDDRDVEPTPAPPARPRTQAHGAFQWPPAVPVTAASPARGIARDADGTDLIAPLVVLQLSDLHFGPHSRFAGSDLDRLAAQCRQSIDEARGDLGWRESVGLVIVTGDVAEAARPPEYVAAASFFTALSRELVLSPHRFVFTPGNHDISWNGCRKVEVDLDDGAFPPDQLRARLDDVKLVHFEKFIRDVHGGKARHEVDSAAVTSLPRGVFIHDFPDLGVSIAALNSCERESHRKEDHIGALSAAQAQAVLDHWRNSPAQLIRLAAVHHNPATMASPAIERWLGFLRSSTAQLPADVVERIATNFVGLEGHEYLRNLAADAHVSLILHGHHHVSASHRAWAWRGRDPGGAGDTRIVSAGSWGLSPESGKLPKDQPVVMQLIRLDPAAAQLHAVLLRYDPTARLSGEVQLGSFLLDPQTRNDRPLGLSLPPVLRGHFTPESASGGAAAAATDEPPPRTRDISAAIADYRARKAGTFERLDLRTTGPQPISSHRPAEIMLDELYTPLRFDGNQDAAGGGVPITVDDLLRDGPPRVVIGNAGSGKTTWMRWTFRRLIRDPRVVPFFLELRAIAAGWRAPSDTGQPIDNYLAAELAAAGTPDADMIVEPLLRSLSGPRPVLLIDGWDELGAQGERLRERLVELCRAFPRIIVVVSSRPYGETRPARAEAFETLYIQPLSDHDVELLATRFHRHVHGIDESAGSRATDEFMAALEAAPDARSLASTALLLTMMLLLSREGPLPDRRHKLYSACLRNMLQHRVNQRERDGAVIDVDQWRPDDGEERLRVAAELAYRMQADGYRSSYRTPIIRSWDAALELFRNNDWTRDRRDRFLRWLVASAGVLIDRTDGSVHFAHLSFQEHLTAYYLFITREGSDRIAIVREYLHDDTWRETLRLWAGLTGDQWPDKLTPVLASLRESEVGYWLAGMIFADGTGSLSDFEVWSNELPTRLSDPLSHGGDCAEVWATCKQAERRTMLATKLAFAREKLSWLDGGWHADWYQLADLNIAIPLAVAVLEAPIDHAYAAARSRALFGRAASWPDGDELAVLRLWPSTRLQIGARLQTAISVGAQVLDLRAMLPRMVALAMRPWSDDEQDLATAFCQDSAYEYVDHRWTEGHSWTESLRINGSSVEDTSKRRFTMEVAHDFVRQFLEHPGRALSSNSDEPNDLHRLCDSVWDIFWEDTTHFERYSKRKIFRDVRAIVALTFVKVTRALARYLDPRSERAFGRALGLDETMTDAPWVQKFALLEVASSFGRAAPRAVLADGVISNTPLLGLFRCACQASFAWKDARHEAILHCACAAFDGDPLWPALARHIARLSTAEDRALLEDAARHPEQRDGALSWGLQHYVRGDLVFDDDSVVTLDDLCAEAGTAPLPLLEDMPDELDVPRRT